MLFEIDDFRVEERLGSGGWAEVFRALDRDGKPVAIKVLSSEVSQRPEAVLRFIDEAGHLAKIRASGATTNVVTFVSHAMWRTEGHDRPYIVMEYVAGQSVRHLLNQKPEGVCPRRACEIVRGAALGAACVHRILTAIHRDIKPANILLDGDTVKLADLGILRRVRRADSGTHGKQAENLTPGGVLIGTPEYAAPEVVGGHEKEIGPWSDVFSLGVTLYELLTGRKPIRLDDGLLYTPTLLQPPPSSTANGKGIPPELEEVCSKCLALFPKDRYPTAEALAAELEQIAASLPPEPQREAVKDVVLPAAESLRHLPPVPRLRAGNTPGETDAKRPFPPRWMSRAAILVAAVAAVAITGLWYSDYLSKLPANDGQKNLPVKDQGEKTAQRPVDEPPALPRRDGKTEALPPDPAPALPQQDTIIEAEVIGPIWNEQDKSYTIKANQPFAVRVSARRPCEIEVWYEDEHDQHIRLFPNNYECDGRLPTGPARRIPADKGKYQFIALSAKAPERLLVIASEQKLEPVRGNVLLPREGYLKADPGEFEKERGVAIRATGDTPAGPTMISRSFRIRVVP